MYTAQYLCVLVWNAAEVQWLDDEGWGAGHLREMGLEHDLSVTCGQGWVGFKDGRTRLRASLDVSRFPALSEKEFRDRWTMRAPGRTVIAGQRYTLRVWMQASEEIMLLSVGLLCLWWILMEGELFLNWMAGSWADNGVGFPSQVSPGFVLIWGFPYAAWCHLHSRNRQFYDVNDMERPS